MAQFHAQDKSNFELYLRKYAALLLQANYSTAQQHTEMLEHLFHEKLLIVYSKDIRSVWTKPKTSGREMTYNGLFGYLEDFHRRASIQRMRWKLSIVDYTPVGSSSHKACQAIVTLQIDVDGKQRIEHFYIVVKDNKIINAIQLDSTEKKDVQKAIRETKKIAVKRFFDKDVFADHHNWRIYIG